MRVTRRIKFLPRAFHVESRCTLRDAEEGCTLPDCLALGCLLGRSQRIAAREQPDVRQGRTKLIDLGLRWRNSGKLALPGLDASLLAELQSVERGIDYPNLVDEAQTGQPDEATKPFGRCVVAEHRRWLLDWAMDGWRQARPGEMRDNVRRIHHKMVPFAALDAKTKRYDAVLVRGQLSLLDAGSANRSRAYSLVAVTITVGNGPLDVSAIDAAPTDLTLRLAPSLADMAEVEAGRLCAAIERWGKQPQSARLLAELAWPNSPGRRPRREQPAGASPSDRCCSRSPPPCPTGSHCACCRCGASGAYGIAFARRRLRECERALLLSSTVVAAAP